MSFPTRILANATRSPKTSLAGAIPLLAVVLFGPDAEWVIDGQAYGVFELSVAAAAVLLGLMSRDGDVSSEQAGVVTPAGSIDLLIQKAAGAIEAASHIERRLEAVIKRPTDTPPAFRVERVDRNE